MNLRGGQGERGDGASNNLFTRSRRRRMRRRRRRRRRRKQQSGGRKDGRCTCTLARRPLHRPLGLGTFCQCRSAPAAGSNCSRSRPRPPLIPPSSCLPCPGNQLQNACSKRFPQPGSVFSTRDFTPGNPWRICQGPGVWAMHSLLGKDATRGGPPTKRTKEPFE